MSAFYDMMSHSWVVLVIVVFVALATLWAVAPWKTEIEGAILMVASGATWVLSVAGMFAYAYWLSAAPLAIIVWPWLVLNVANPLYALICLRAQKSGRR